MPDGDFLWLGLMPRVPSMHVACEKRMQQEDKNQYGNKFTWKNHYIDACV